uniref:Uncharacterized protein n=1 Tax=Plectus sambesii TaxID=2011161 RepID=A0A914XSS2_9BILA
CAHCLLYCLLYFCSCRLFGSAAFFYAPSLTSPVDEFGSPVPPYLILQRKMDRARARWLSPGRRWRWRARGRSKSDADDPANSTTDVIGFRRPQDWRTASEWSHVVAVGAEIGWKKRRRRLDSQVKTDSERANNGHDGDRPTAERTLPKVVVHAPVLGGVTVCVAPPQPWCILSSNRAKEALSDLCRGRLPLDAAPFCDDDIRSRLTSPARCIPPSHRPLPPPNELILLAQVPDGMYSP